jgi:hypothetical protein
METKPEYATQAPLAISERRETYVRSDGTTFTRSDIFVKLAVTFRDQMLSKLKGPPLSVYLCIALHCGGPEMTAYPSLKTISKETGYSRTSVIEATRKLQKMGLIRIWHREHAEERYPDSNLYEIRGYATMGEGSTPSVPGVVKEIDYRSTPSVPKEESMKEESIEEERGAVADGFVDINDDPFWDEHDKDTNPAHEQVERMRSKMGSDPFSVAAHCQQQQEVEGTWTVPVHRGLSPACAVFKEGTGYAPAKVLREEIDQAIPNDPGALEMWFRVCRDWIKCGFKYSNVGGMLECYAEGRLPSAGFRRGNGDGGSSGPREHLVSVQPAEPAWLGEPT